MGGAVALRLVPIRRRLPEPLLHSVLSVATPFLAYLPAELLHVAEIDSDRPLPLDQALKAGRTRLFDWRVLEPYFRNRKSRQGWRADRMMRPPQEGWEKTRPVLVGWLGVRYRWSIRGIWVCDVCGIASWSIQPVVGWWRSRSC
ncbi:hypothetical protein ACFU6I_41245 [Streptomyces sp. NPDC057486]|uniref:hypothetical protein n=1 Tax=Streptomyces sp. NPDC057486 TaxID=3346145 RepID=UPI003686EE24